MAGRMIDWLGQGLLADIPAAAGMADKISPGGLALYLAQDEGKLYAFDAVLVEWIVGGGGGGGGASGVTIINASRTLTADDASSLLICDDDADITLTIPTNADVELPVPAEISGFQTGAGKVLFVADGGVAMLTPTGAQAKTRGQGAAFTLAQYGTDAWALTGDLNVPSGGGGGGGGLWYFNPPLAADFATNFSGNANNVIKTDDDDVGLLVTTGGANAGIMGCGKALPVSGDWEATCHIVGNMRYQNYASCMMTLFDSALNRVSMIGSQYDGGFYIDPADWSLTGFSARGARQYSSVQEHFFRITFNDTANEYNFYWSNNGKVWNLARTTTQGAWLTANYIGLSMVDQGNLVCDYWEQSW